MNVSKARAEMIALREAALSDLLATSDSQLRQEAIDDGEDVDKVAIQMQVVMRDAAAKVLRQRLAEAKARMRPGVDQRVIPSVRPNVETIKQMVQGLFQSDPSLSLAFRDGKTQTDADWISLYDDLVAMGTIQLDDHGS
jgi:hypothetical protein